MTTPVNSEIATRLSRISRACGALAVAFGTAVLAGWIFHIRLAKMIVPGQVNVKVNTALCFLLLGAVLWLWRDDRPLSRARTTVATLALIFVAIIGSISLIECMTGWNAGIDQLLLAEAAQEAHGSVRPGLMSPITAIGFLLLAPALILLRRKTSAAVHIAHMFCAVVATVSLFGVLDFVLDPRHTHTHISPITASLLLILSFAIPASRPDRGLGAMLASETLGGMLSRRLLPAALFIPVTLGWLRWKGAVLGLYSEWAGVSLMIVSVAVLVTIVSLWTALIADKADRERVRADERSLQLASIVNFSSEAIIGKTLDGTVTSWNPAAEETYGYTADEMIGSPISKIVPSDHIDEFNEMLTRLRNGKRIQHFESERVRKDGTRVQVSVAVAPIRDATGRLVGASTVARDITEQKRAEQALQIERQRFRDVLDKLPVYVILLTPDYHVAMDNTVFRERFGESHGRRCYEYLFNRETPCEICETYSVLKNGSPHQWKWTGPDGRDYDIYDFPFTDTDGSPLILEMGLDVTERNRAEAALHDSEVKFRALSDLVPQLVWMCTPDGLNIYFNQRWVEYTGLTLEESYGQGWNRPFHDDDRQAAWDAWNHAVATGEIYRVESRLRAADGSYRWFLMRGVPVRDNSGKIVKWFGTCTDIHDMKQAQAELKQLNQELDERVRRRTAELQAVFNTSPIGLAITEDAKATHIYGNPANERFIGVQPGAELSKSSPNAAPYRVFKDGRELSPDELPMQRAAKGETVTGYEMEIMRPDGTIVTTYASAAPLFDEKQRPRGAVGAFVDLSERKRQERALQESETRFRALANSVPDLVWTCTADGSCNFLNSRWVDYTGIPERDQLGTAWLAQVHPDDRDRVTGEWNKTLREGTSFDVEFRIRGEDGAFRWFKTRAVAVRDDQGRILKWFGTNTDIEDLRRYQAALMAANKELEAFTYSVSHDLRAPLRHISGFSKILLEDYEAALPEDARRLLDRVCDGTRRMGLLVDDLLNLGRVGRHELRLQVTGLNTIVREVIASLRTECEGRQVDWNIENLPYVECDPGLVGQVFQNLLSNALKFTRPRATAVIEVGQEQIDGGVVIFVRDNGVGFNMKYADKLFGVFQRLHRAEDFEGTGVGLATVQRIVQKHGGKIWAEAELDKGATFYFTLGHAEPSPTISTSKPEKIHELA